MIAESKMPDDSLDQTVGMPEANAMDVFFTSAGLAPKLRQPGIWQRRLSKKNRFARLQRVLGAGRTSPLLWGLAAEVLDSDARNALQSSFDQARKDRNPFTSEEVCDREIRTFAPLPNADGANQDFACAAWIHLAQLSPLLVANLPIDAGCALLERLFRRIEQTRHGTLNNPRLEQLLKIELPLTLAHQFPELVALQTIAADASSQLEKSLYRWLDPTGNLESCWWADHRSIFAGWIRSLRILQTLEQAPPAEGALKRLRLFFRQVQRAACSPRHALLIPHHFSGGFRRMIGLAESVLRERSRLRNRPKKKRVAALGGSSQAAGLTLMQTRWGFSGAKVGVRHGDCQLTMHIWRTQSLISGDCMPQIALGSNALQPQDRWEVSCWYGDSDVQLLDLELKMQYGVRLERTVVLGTRDEFLLVADSVTVDEPHDDIRYTADFPLADGMFASGESETNEVYLRNEERLRSLVLPLAAPEWKAARGSANLEILPTALKLTQTAKGRVLYAPLFFDLKPNRSLSARTWRQLTVARRREIVGKEFAVGIRIRIGQKQWLLFRSFEQQEPYSVLSKHLMCEFYLGRIEPDQSITDLVRVD